jgi:hypothetical protein
MFGTSNGERERNNEMLLDNNLDALPWSLVCVVTGDHGDGSLCYPESTRANGVIACTITQMHLHPLGLDMQNARNRLARVEADAARGARGLFQGNWRAMQ